MPSDKHDYSALSDPPIPTYEEATSSRPPSAHSRRGPSEISDDAERQELLLASAQPRRRDGYQAPYVQSVRSSQDSLAYFGEEEEEALNDAGAEYDEEDEGLRHDMEQMEVLDPEEADSPRARMRSRLSKRISSLTTSLSTIGLPSFRIPIRFPHFEAIASRLPNISLQYVPGWSIVARLMGLFIIISLAYALFVAVILPGSSVGLGQPFNPEWVRAVAQNSVDGNRIREYLRHITSFDHVAGSEGDFYLAQWVEGLFRASGMDAVENQQSVNRMSFVQWVC